MPEGERLSCELACELACVLGEELGDEPIDRLRVADCFIESGISSADAGIDLLGREQDLELDMARFIVDIAWLVSLAEVHGESEIELP